MIIQCPSCRELAQAERAILNEDGTRAGIECSACGELAWLPLGPTTPAATGDEPPVAAAVATNETPDAMLVEALALPAEGPVEEPLVEGLRALASRWSDYEAHRALIRRAHAVGAMPALGVRYRRVLQARPGDEVAKRAQQEILTLAMASLSTMAGNAAVDGTAAADARKRKQAMAALIAMLVFVLVSATFLTVILRAL